MDSRPIMPHPEPSQASPTEASYLDDPEMQFWRPDWKQTARYLGWKWLWFLPIPAGLGLMVLAWYIHPLRALFWNGAMIKLAIVVYGAAAGAIISAVKSGVKARAEPFCIRCGYALVGLPDGHRCPECGLPVNHRMISEYRRDPEGFVQRWRARKHLPAAAVAFEVPRPMPAPPPSVGGIGEASGAGPVPADAGEVVLEPVALEPVVLKPVTPRRRKSRDGT